MNRHLAIRKVISATVLAAALSLSAGAAGAASADSGVSTESLEVAHVGFLPDAAVVEPASTKYKDIELKPPLHHTTYNFDNAWPRK